MTDLITDIKTRLIQQSAEFGISRETAAMLAACIDDTAKDYAGERVYIGRSVEVQLETSRRNRAIIRDWKAGERVALLARRYGISRMQIYRIIEGV